MGVVFDCGEDGVWDVRGVCDLKVLFVGLRDIWVYYVLIDVRTGKFVVGLAFTADGFAYSKCGLEVIFGFGLSGLFDDVGVVVLCVVRFGWDEFIMFYEVYLLSASGVASVVVAMFCDGVLWICLSVFVFEVGVVGVWD